MSITAINKTNSGNKSANICNAAFHENVQHNFVYYTISEKMASGDDCKASFQAFCEFGGKGKTTMTTKNCTKLFKDCKLYSKSLTTTDTDIGFSKVKTKGKT